MQVWQEALAATHHHRGHVIQHLQRHRLKSKQNAYSLSVSQSRLRLASNNFRLPPRQQRVVLQCACCIDLLHSQAATHLCAAGNLKHHRRQLVSRVHHHQEGVVVALVCQALSTGACKQKSKQSQHATGSSSRHKLLSEPAAHCHSCLQLVPLMRVSTVLPGLQRCSSTPKAQPLQADSILHSPDLTSCMNSLAEMRSTPMFSITEDLRAASVVSG